MNMKWLQNNKLLRNIFTIILIIAVYSAAIVYMGILKGFEFDSDILTTIGAFSIIAFVGVKSIRWDTTQRAFIDENTGNDELVDVNKNIVEQNKLIKDDILGMKCVDEWNIRDQEKANVDLTDRVLSKLRKKLRNIRIKSDLPRRYKWFSRFNSIEEIVTHLETEIKLIEANPLFDKKFKKMKYDDVINVSDVVKTKVIPKHKKYKYDPRKDSWWSWFFSIFKFVGISATAVPFKPENLDVATLLSFYLALSITVVITVIWRYTTIRKRTGSIYLQIRRDKFNDIVKINNYINAAESKEEVEIFQEQSDKAQILKIDKDVVFKMDGNKCCVHRKDFINLHESICGFGDTYELAYKDLLNSEQIEYNVDTKIEMINRHFETNKGDYTYTHLISDLISIKDFSDRLTVLGFKVIPVTNQFGKESNVLRIKKENR